MVTDVSVTCISFYGAETPLPFRRQCSLSLYPSHLNLTISLINRGCLHRDVPSSASPRLPPAAGCSGAASRLRRSSRAGHSHTSCNPTRQPDPCTRAPALVWHLGRDEDAWRSSVVCHTWLRCVGGAGAGGMLQSQPPTPDASARSSEQQKQGQVLYKGVLVLVWFFLTANPFSAV